MEMEKIYLVNSKKWLEIRSSIQHNHYKQKHITLRYTLKSHNLTGAVSSYSSI